MARSTKMNNITSPELLAQVNRENNELLGDFLDYLRSVQRSETTIRGYENDIQIAWVWCLKYNNNKFFVDWTKRNVVAYQNWLLNNNENSPARVRRLKSSLSSLSNYIESVCDDEYEGFRNIINKVESPINQPVREKTVFSEDDISLLLSTLVSKGKYEKACTLALAAYGGRRKAELSRFKVSDFDDSHIICDGALYKSSPIKTKGRGVNGKMLECYTLVKRFKPYLDMWLQYRAENGIDSEWLLVDPSDNCSPISISTLNSWANSFSRVLNMSFYWHSLRHLFTSMLAQSGIPDGVIADIVGWSDVSLVSVYNDTPKDNQIGAWFKNGDINIDKKSDITQL